MNLLELSKDKIISKAEGTNVKGDCMKYFQYGRRVVTSHLESRKVFISSIPGSEIVGSMNVDDILDDIRK